MTKTKQRTIKVDYLARVEGEGSLLVKIKDNKVTDAKLKIFEPPRFFEAFLRGRDFLETPDITARICGICPVAYQMSSVHALEDACQISVTPDIKMLRRLLYCGEWIESHTLHIYMLHAPDFLGFPDAITLAQKFPEKVKDGLQLKKIGNQIVEVVGGRAIHPVNVKVGGFYKMPAKSEFLELKENLKKALDIALKTVKWVSKFHFPEFENDYLFVSLSPDHEYPFNEGSVISNGGLNISAEKFNKHFKEDHVKHSNALQGSTKNGAPYFVGPLARFNLCYDKLTKSAKQSAQDISFKPGCSNPYKSILARSVEVVFACEEALRIINELDFKMNPSVKVKPIAGTGHSATEAPRGILYHQYTIDSKGLIKKAQIVPPTSQNQKQIEKDLRAFVNQNTKLSDSKLTHLCEQMIRNYDPCISCATHFLKLSVERDS